MVARMPLPDINSLSRSHRTLQPGVRHGWTMHRRKTARQAIALNWSSFHPFHNHEPYVSPQLIRDFEDGEKQQTLLLPMRAPMHCYPQKGHERMTGEFRCSEL